LDLSPASADDAQPLEDRKHDGCGHDRTDLPPRIGPHGMHEQVVVLVLPLALVLHNPRRHGIRGNPGRPDQRIDLPPAQETHEFAQQEAAHRVDDDRHQTQTQDQERLLLQKGVAFHRSSDGQPQEKRADTGNFILARMRQPLHRTRRLEKIPQHDHAHQRQPLRRDQPGHPGDHQREKHQRRFRNPALGIGHPDPPLFPSRHQAHDRRLQDRDQRHVTVRRHRGGRQQVRGELRGNKDHRRTVAGPDHPDGDGLFFIEPRPEGQAHGQKNTQLSGRTEKQDLGIGQQRGEIRHRPDPDENQQREKFTDDSRLIQGSQDPVVLHDPAQRQVDQETSEADRYQQQRLHALRHTQPQQHPGARQHDQVRPHPAGHHAPEPLGQRIKTGKNRIKHTFNPWDGCAPHAPGKAGPAGV